MLDHRSKRRRRPKAHFGVYSAPYGELIGYVVDLTTKGVRLISSRAIERNDSFEFRMDLPPGILDRTALSFKAKSKWCKKCEESWYYESGFKILECSDSDIARIKTLLASELFEAEGEDLHISFSMARS